MTAPRTLPRLLSLLPVHLRARDAEAGGTVNALLTAVATEIELLEDDLHDLYDGWFIETCAEWLVPYIADLVGVRVVPPDLGTTVSRRALVANTVGYRRRKGTVAALEQVARDVTGWPTRAVEYHALLVASTHVNHVRLDRPATASLRGSDALERSVVRSPTGALGALDSVAHTAEARSIESRRGRYGIGRVGAFTCSVQVAVVGSGESWPQARQTGDSYTVDPLGRDVPLFAPPEREPSPEHLATEQDLPVPLRPRRLLRLLKLSREGLLDPDDLPVAVAVDGVTVPVERLRACGVEGLAPGPDPQVVIDTVRGRLRLYDGGVLSTAATLTVRAALGGPADVGASTYDRTERHTGLLASDPYVPAHPSDPSDPTAAPAAAQVEVRSGEPASPARVPTVGEAINRTVDAWEETSSSTLGQTSVISIGDHATYDETLTVAVPESTRLVVVTGRWPHVELPNGDMRAPVPGRYAAGGVRPHLLGGLTVTGAPGASVVLDGLLVDGDVVVAPGSLRSLTLAHCTLAGTLRVDADDDQPQNSLTVRLVRSILGGVSLADTVPAITIVDCVVDPAQAGLPLPDPTPPALSARGAQATIDTSTVRGEVTARSLDASSTLLDGVVDVEHRQVGCVRYCYVAPGSRTPRRFRCVPADPAAGSPMPVYVSDDPASPAYLMLASRCSPQIGQGGEHESEMGVHHHLNRPRRLRAAQDQLDTYRPVGIDIGIFGS